MKLSRAGWNNVIIFSVMAYILVINTTQKTLFGDDETNSSHTNFALPESSVVLTIEYDGAIVFERIGQSWRSRPANLMTSQSISALVLAWSQAHGLIYEAPLITNSNDIVNVFVTLAGEYTPIQYSLIRGQDEAFLINRDTNETLSISPEIMNQLIPFELANTLKNDA